jgi:peptidoglycan/LPS O-acetylase OafA/YrhL
VSGAPGDCPTGATAPDGPRTRTEPSARTSAAIPRGEIHALTGLRIVAALWVVLFHFGFTPGVATGWFWQRLALVVDEGALGVDLFFVLSGFVITLTYLDTLGSRPSVRATVGFWWTRICRIWPVYATVTALFGVWLVVRSTEVDDGISYQTVQPVLDPWHFLEQLAMVQLWHRPYFDGSSWVGPAWSISAEWLAYVCFPALVLLLWRLRNAPSAVTAPLAVVCMLPFAWLCWSTGNPYLPWSWLLRIGMGFLAGAVTCLAVRRIRCTARVGTVAAWTTGAAFLGILAVLWWTHRAVGGHGEVVVMFFPVLVGALALSTRGPSRVLGLRPMVHGGRISYSLYLVHVPVFEILWTLMRRAHGFGPTSIGARAVVPLVPVLVLLLAHLLHRRLEEPARLALRGRGPGRWARRERTAGRVVATD